MSEFCLDCFNKYFSENKKLEEKDVILKEDLCEGCAAIKPCVMRIKLTVRLRNYIKDKKAD